MTQVPRHLIRLTVLYLCLHSFITAPAPTVLLPEQTWIIEELAKADAPPHSPYCSQQNSNDHRAQTGPLSLRNNAKHGRSLRDTYTVAYPPENNR